MKANELMIGDWVLKDMYYSEEDPMYTRPAYQPYQIQNGEDIDLACETNCIGDADVYLPIPLTPEILEKNGFVPKFSDGCLTEYLIYKDIVDGLHEMYIRITYFNTEEKEHKLECFDCRTGGCQIWIKYVHQLQHALRLCGIDKEIEI